MDASEPGTRVSPPAGAATGGVFVKPTTRLFSVAAGKLRSATSVSRTGSFIITGSTLSGSVRQLMLGPVVPARGRSVYRSLAPNAR